MLEFDQGLPQCLNGGKDFRPQQVLLEQTNEALRAAVAFRFSNKTGRGFKAQEFQFLLEIIGPYKLDRDPGALSAPPQSFPYSLQSAPGRLSRSVIALRINPHCIFMDYKESC